MNQEYIVLDIETTGNTNNEILEFSMLVCDHNGNILKNLSKTYKAIPNESIVWAATAVHGISNFFIDNIKSNKTVAKDFGYEPQEVVLQKILNDLIEYAVHLKMPVIGYNHIAFDLKWLKHNIIRYACKDLTEDDPRVVKIEKLFKYLEDNSIDIFTFAKTLYNSNELGDLKLSTVYLAECAKSEEDVQHLIELRNVHGAYADCVLTNKIYQSFIKTISANSIDDIRKHINTPKMLEVIPFGKYKNRTFKEILQVDPEYLYWMVKTYTKENKEKNIVYTIMKLVEERNKQEQ